MIVMEIDEAVGQLYAALYRLRLQGKYQEEYDSMGTLMGMLATDRGHLRDKHPEIETAFSRRSA